MRRIIDKYADGIFEYETGKLSFSIPKIEESMPIGDVLEGSFTLASDDGSEFAADLFSSDIRMICRNDHVEGTGADIRYVFDSTGLEPGDVIKGEIRVVSNCGEYYLPFAVSITYGVAQNSMGNVRNLFHFANQAQTDWEEAVSLFYSPSFARVFGGNDRIHYGKYRGYSNIEGNAQSVDDFIVSVNKKRPIVYSVDRSTYEYNDVFDTVRCEVLLHKSTWGNIDVDVMTDVSFIQLEKDKLATGDFLGNSHNLVFYILGDLLHEGRNFGRITIKSAYQELNITIIARHRARVNAKRIERREKRNLTARLMQRYVEFRMKKTNVNSWVRESMKIVERLNALDDKNPVSRLFQVQLLTVQHRENEAGWILEHVENEMHINECSAQVYAYFLYLKTLISRDEAFIDETAEKISELYRENPHSFEILWTLLYLDGELAQNTTRKLMLIEKLFDEGCTSPVLYIEAYNFFAASPEKLSKLSRFEMQILMFALKQGVISDDLLKQFAYIASKQKVYTEQLYKLLCLAYDISEDNDFVDIICSMLIKGGVSGTRYFIWFDRAIKLQLRITKVYEYYMYSIPLDYEGIIPKSVLMYFGYRNDMNYHRIAFMYANLITHKREYAESYETYREHIQIFAIEQIALEHIDRNLAIIYEDVLFAEMIKPEMAQHLAKILFAYEVKIDYADAKNVVLVQEEFEGEMIFPVENGYAYPTIYSGNYTLFVEDGYRRRRILSSDCVKKLLNEAVFIQAIRYYVNDNVYFFMYLCQGRKQYVSVDESNVEYCRMLAESDKVSEYYKRDIRMALLHYYYDNDQITTLDEFIIHLDVKVLGSKDRAEVIKYMAKRGMFEEAYEIISVYGVQDVSPKVCVRICSHMIEKKDEVMDILLVKLCYAAFVGGKYDEVTLKYLIVNYRGLTKELRNIWKAAVEFDVECTSLMERLIIQMLYTHVTVGEKEEIFEMYMRSGASTRVTLAYLSYAAYEYFAKERLTDSKVFEHIEDLYKEGEGLNDACKLALLKYYSEEKIKYADKSRKMLKEFLVYFMHRNIYLKFFEYYSTLVPEIEDYIDKTIIEYRTNPNYRVTLHYYLEGGDEEDSEYHTEELKNMFGGVFTKEFILFFGENLQYYITEEMAGKEVLTASDSISVSDTYDNRVESRYTMLNDMVVSKTVQDEDTLVEIMKDYVEADAFSHRIFKLR